MAHFGTSFDRTAKFVFAACLVSIVAMPAPTLAQGPPTITWQGTHAGLANAVAFSPDGQLVASGSADRTTKVWRASDGALLHTLVQCSGIGCRGAGSLAFSPDGQILATAGSNLKLWNVADGTLLRTISQTAASIRFSPDGQTLLGTGSGSGYNSQFVVEIRVADGVTLRTLSGGGVASAYSPDGSKIAAVGRHGFDLWDAATGQLLRHLNGAHSALAFEPGGEHVAVAGNGVGDYRYDDTITFYRVDDGTAVRTLTRTGSVGSLTFSSDGQTLVSGSWDPNENFVNGFLPSTGALRFWSVADGSVRVTYDRETGTSANSPALAPGGQAFAYTHDSTVVVAAFPNTSCAASIVPDSVVIPLEGGSGSFEVLAPEGCAWTSAGRVDWIHVTGGATGTGNGTVTFTVDPAFISASTDSSDRASEGAYDGIVGQIVAAGRSFLVNLGAEGDGCYFLLQPASATFGAEGGDGGVSVSSPSGCGWRAVGAPEWIHPSADVHVGNGGILYHVDALAATPTGSRSPRVGTFAIGDATFTVTQSH
jgi:hypothetical protein